MNSTQPYSQRTIRSELFAKLAQGDQYDVAIIGGGATGLGIALDAAARGFKVVLFESQDFAKGTSSRSTKLVHGGVRYLAQGNISLVREALHERTTLLANAPHLAQPLAFVMPSYSWWQRPFYGIGLKLYDLLAGKAGLNPTEFLTSKETGQLLPNLRLSGLSGGVKYWDGQFDDARLALALAKTAAKHGALLINYCPAKQLIYDHNMVCGLQVEDAESGISFDVSATCVINATGVWVDTLRQQDGQSTTQPVKPMVAPSQGVHIVVDRKFLPTDHALMIPKTSDGRVLFAVPWLGKVILGTTDTPRSDLATEPEAFAEEIQFILSESAKVLTTAPQRSDVKSIWVGLRPLVKHEDDDSGNTKAISREHTIVSSKSGLITVTGGKWTTYRAMAEDVLSHAIGAQLLPQRPGGVTNHLPLVGAQTSNTMLSEAPGIHLYGSESIVVQSLPGCENELTGTDVNGDQIVSGLTEAMIAFAARYEFARTVEDVLARRSRLLFLDAQLALQLAPVVAEILRRETNGDVQLAAFELLAHQYMLQS
jgi:glycerol-3-phosphate dehydrogenase